MSDIYLIQITGRDQVGVLAGVCSVLSQHDTEVLDIGEAVIHSSLSLNLLIRLPPSADLQHTSQSLLTLLEPVGLRCEIEEVSEAAYSRWVVGGGQRRHIITLLTAKLTAGQMDSVARVCSQHGMNIDRMTRLSGRRPLGFNATPSQPHCVEMSVRGEAEDAVALREDWLQVAEEMGLDISIQEDNLYRRHRRLVAFDMDSTLIEMEVIDELARLGGCGDEVAELTERAMRGEMAFDESLRRRTAALAGIDQSVMEEVAANMPLTPGAERLVRILKKLGYRIAIISGGFEYFASRLGERLNADYVYANHLEIEDGRLTGKLRGRLLDGKGKARRLREICRKEGIALEQAIAVGDGANDLEMLATAGLGIAYRAKPKVAAASRHAISRGSLDAIRFLLGISDHQLQDIDQQIAAEQDAASAACG